MTWYREPLDRIGAMVAAYVAWEIPSAVVALLSGPIRFLAPATMRMPAGPMPGAGTNSVLPATGHLGDLVLSVTRSGHQLVVTYLPAGRFWTLQLIAAALFLAIAAAALGGGRLAAASAHDLKGAHPMNVPVVLVIILGGVLVVGWDIFCLHDMARADRVRYLPRWGWAIVCLLSNPWGGILYVIFGREGFGRDL